MAKRKVLGIGSSRVLIAAVALTVGVLLGSYYVKSQTPGQEVLGTEDKNTTPYPSRYPKPTKQPYPSYYPTPSKSCPADSYKQYRFRCYKGNFTGSEGVLRSKSCMTLSKWKELVSKGCSSSF